MDDKNPVEQPKPRAVEPKDTFVKTATEQNESSKLVNSGAEELKKILKPEKLDI